MIAAHRAARRRPAGPAPPARRAVWLEPYLPIAVVAALDAVFGALRAFLDGIFDDKVFVVSFVSNVLIAGADRLPRRQARRRRRSCRPASSSCSASGSSPTSPRSAGTLPCLSRDAQSRARAGTRTAATALVAALASARVPRPAGVAVLLGVLGFAAVAQVQANSNDDQYVGCAAGRPDPVHQRPLGRLPAAEPEIADLQRTRDALPATPARRTALERRAAAGEHPRHPRRHRAGRRPGRPGHGHRPEGRRRHQPAARRDRGAPGRRRRGDRDQQQGPGRRPDLARGRPRRGRSSTASCSRRRTSSTRSASPHDLATALDFKGGFIDEVQRPSVDGKVTSRRSDERRRSPRVAEADGPQYAQPGKTG